MTAYGLRRAARVGRGDRLDRPGRPDRGDRRDRPDRPDRPAQRLRVDWPLCRGRGLCAELLPELVRLDEWGYPIVTGPVEADLVDGARDAVRMCPHVALRLVDG